MKIHANLKNPNILKFINAIIVEKEHGRYVPGGYILLEMASGGDLFDRIGLFPSSLTCARLNLRLSQFPTSG